MCPKRAVDMHQMHGADAVFLLGGSLLEAGTEIERRASELRNRLDKLA